MKVTETQKVAKVGNAYLIYLIQRMADYGVTFRWIRQTKKRMLNYI
jgi:hypothetical protein